MPVGERLFAYDPGENILSLGFRGVHLKTQEDLDGHFDALVDYWRSRCGGRKVYWLVDYHDFSVDMRENEHYARHMRRIFDETALAVVRYGGTALQHAAVHLYSLRLHKSANVYATREEALEVIRRIRAGTLNQA